jgi:hypothetical protein
MVIWVVNADGMPGAAMAYASRTAKSRFGTGILPDNRLPQKQRVVLCESRCWRASGTGAAGIVVKNVAVDSQKNAGGRGPIGP